jgi:hypothetical protein
MHQSAAGLDQIACVRISGLLLRLPMNAGQDGFRDKSSKQNRHLTGAVAFAAEQGLGLAARGSRHRTSAPLASRGLRQPAGFNEAAAALRGNSGGRATAWPKLPRFNEAAAALPRKFMKEDEMPFDASILLQ